MIRILFFDGTWTIPKLSAAARDFNIDVENELYINAASAWEFAIRNARGRLKLPEKPEVYLPSRMAAHRIHPLPVENSHALHVSSIIYPQNATI